MQEMVCFCLFGTYKSAASSWHFISTC